MKNQKPSQEKPDVPEHVIVRIEPEEKSEEPRKPPIAKPVFYVERT